jgi:predicted transcriptional regulator
VVALPLEEEILKQLASNDVRDIEELAIKLKVEEEIVRETLNRLKSAGLLLI